MSNDDPDENPSLGQTAGWVSELAELGILGVFSAIVIAIWARQRHRCSSAR